MNDLLLQYFLSGAASQKQFLRDERKQSYQSSLARAVKSIGLESFREQFNPKEENEFQSHLLSSVKEKINEHFPPNDGVRSPESQDEPLDASNAGGTSTKVDLAKNELSAEDNGDGVPPKVSDDVSRRATGIVKSEIVKGSPPAPSGVAQPSQMATMKAASATIEIDSDAAASLSPKASFTTSEGVKSDGSASPITETSTTSPALLLGPLREDITLGSITLSAKNDLPTLEHSKLVNDQIMNSMLRLVAEEFDDAYTLPTFFWSNLMTPVVAPNKPNDVCDMTDKSDDVCSTETDAWTQVENTAGGETTSGWNRVKRYLNKIPPNARFLIIPVHSTYGENLRGKSTWVEPNGLNGHWSVIVRARNENDDSFTFYYQDSLNDANLHRLVQAGLVDAQGVYNEERDDKWERLISTRQVENECGAAAILNAYSMLLDLAEPPENGGGNAKVTSDEPGRRHQDDLEALKERHRHKIGKLTRAWVKTSLLNGKVAPLHWLRTGDKANVDPDAPIMPLDSTKDLPPDSLSTPKADDDEPDDNNDFYGGHADGYRSPGDIQAEIDVLRRASSENDKRIKILKEELSTVVDEFENNDSSPRKPHRLRKDGMVDQRYNNGAAKGSTFRYLDNAKTVGFILKWYNTPDTALDPFCRDNADLLEATRVKYNAIATVVRNARLEDGGNIRQHKKRGTLPDEAKLAIEEYLSLRVEARESHLQELSRTHRVLKEFEENVLVSMISSLATIGHPPTVSGVRRLVSEWREYMDFDADDEPEMPSDATIRRIIDRSDGLTRSARASSIDVKRSMKASPETGRAWFMKIAGTHSVLYNDPTVNMPKEWKTFADVPPEYIYNFDELSADTNARYDKVVANAENLRKGLRLFKVGSNGDDKKQSFHVTAGVFTNASGTLLAS